MIHLKFLFNLGTCKNITFAECISEKFSFKLSIYLKYTHTILLYYIYFGNHEVIVGSAEICPKVGDDLGQAAV